MAERRMFAKSIMMSDRFMDLSAEAKLLYVGLCLSADDEGFTDTTRSVITLSKCKSSALNSLVKAGYVIKFSKDVSLIVHWKIHNNIRKDRKKESKFYKLKKLIAENPDGSYVLLNDTEDKRLTDDGRMADRRLTNDGQMTDKCPHSIGEYRLGKDRLDKGSVGKNSIGEDSKEEESVGKEEILPPSDTVFSCEGENDFLAPDSNPFDNSFGDNGKEAYLCDGTPTLKEIKDYCQKESLVFVNSEIFFNHYDAFSWRYPDGTRIKNWQALLKKWNAQDREKRGKNTYQGRETFYGDSLYADTSKLEV